MHPYPPVYSTHPPDRNFLNLQSAAGYTALDLAREGAHHKMEEWLIALGALGREGTGLGSLMGSGGRGVGGSGAAMHHPQQQQHQQQQYHQPYQQQQQQHQLHHQQQYGGGAPSPYGMHAHGQPGIPYGGVGMLGQGPPGAWGPPRGGGGG